MDRAEYRRQSSEAWGALAVGWERRREYIERVSQPVTEWLVQELDAAPGDVILELAAGPGGTGFATAERLGEQGRLISTDFSPEMVEVARRRAAELGTHNVDFRVMDGERIELEADSVDGVLCRFGYMLMADADTALAETRRVLRPEGRLALAVWGPPERNPWAAVAAGVLVERGHMPPPEPGAPGPFALGDEQRLGGMLEAAGFTGVRIEEVAVGMGFPDVDEYVAFASETGGPFAAVLRELSTGDVAAVKDQLADRFAPFAIEDGFELPGVALAAAAR